MPYFTAACSLMPNAAAPVFAHDIKAAFPVPMVRDRLAICASTPRASLVRSVSPDEICLIATAMPATLMAFPTPENAEDADFPADDTDACIVPEDLRMEVVALCVERDREETLAFAWFVALVSALKSAPQRTIKFFTTAMCLPPFWCPFRRTSGLAPLPCAASVRPTCLGVGRLRIPAQTAAPFSTTQTWKSAARIDTVPVVSPAVPVRRSADMLAHTQQVPAGSCYQAVLW